MKENNSIYKSDSSEKCSTPHASLFMTEGQAMIMTVLALGGTMLGATTIAGLLMVYQIRQSTDMSSSVKAIYAADAGIEWQLHNYFMDPDLPLPSFSNTHSSVSTTIICSPVACSNDPLLINNIEVRSVGKNGSASRAFRINF
ncbi:MAG: hypothetical protein V1856_01465 [Candidatus Liptonbacteria bacterium]